MMFVMTKLHQSLLGWKSGVHIVVLVVIRILPPAIRRVRVATAGNIFSTINYFLCLIKNICQSWFSLFFLLVAIIMSAMMSSTWKRANAMCIIEQGDLTHMRTTSGRDFIVWGVAMLVCCEDLS